MKPINLTKDYELRPFDLQKTADKVDLTLRDLFEILNKSESKYPGTVSILI